MIIRVQGVSEWYGPGVIRMIIMVQGLSEWYGPGVGYQNDMV